MDIFDVDVWFSCFLWGEGVNSPELLSIEELICSVEAEWWYV